MVLPNLPNRNIYDEVNEDAELAEMVARMQALYPSWQPSETDPQRLSFSAVAWRLTLGKIFFNHQARNAFVDDAVGSGLRGTAKTLGVLANTGEMDEPLRERLIQHLQSVGRSASYTAYEADARRASTSVADVEITLDVAPNENRIIVNLLATEAASESRADNLLGVPPAAVVTAVQTFLRDPVRLRVGDEDVIARAATPTEYRIAALITPSTAAAAARQAAYDFIDERRRFGEVLRASNLATAMENAGATAADVTTFNVVGSSGTAILTATGAQYYDCAKNATGVVITS